ncbi:MAG: exodeoxyribonuclease III [Bacteroidales bacterium]|nr:exodeoxyribonuclease III [Bacteroidales bacterium]
MKLISFNINGIRARPHQLRALVELHAPDIIGLQETKVVDDLFPLTDIHELGYEAVFHGQKGHYGVALLHRRPLLDSRCGFVDDGEDAQRRLVYGVLDSPLGPVHVYNGYFPQGENRSHPIKFPAKRAFYRNLLDHLQKHHSPDELVVVMGDMNVAPLDKDIGIGDDNRKRWLREGKCCFLPEEREWLARLSDWGLGDTFERAFPSSGEQRYTWFDYRSKGFERSPRRGLRIDLILATAPLLARQKAAGVDHVTRAMERPSDHAPAWVEFDLG